MEHSSTTQKQAFSHWLDLIRWVAAFSVVLGHIGNRFVARIGDVGAADRTVPFYVFSLLAGFAHQAVMVFFVLSGYLVGGSLWKEAKANGSIDLPKYLVKRVARLSIVVYPTLVAILVLNLIGIHAFQGLANGVYAEKVVRIMQPASFACNATYLQTALCEPYGDDGALWSLYNEFWYYLIWPLILLGVLTASLWKRTWLWCLVACFLLGLSLLQTKPIASLGPYMLIWLLGAGVAIARRPIVRSSSWSVAAFVCGALVYRFLVRQAFQESHPIGLFFADAAVSLLFANMLLSMRDAESLPSPIAGSLHTALASFSFSLYCIHTPVLNLYGAALKYYLGTGWRMVPDRLWKWLIVIGGVALSLAAGYGLSLVTEVHTDGLRKALLKQLDAVGRPKPITIDGLSNPSLGTRPDPSETRVNAAVPGS